MIFKEVTVFYKDGSSEVIHCTRLDSDDSLIQLENEGESISIISISVIKKIEIKKAE